MEEDNMVIKIPSKNIYHQTSIEDGAGNKLKGVQIESNVFENKTGAASNELTLRINEKWQGGITYAYVGNGNSNEYRLNPIYDGNNVYAEGVIKIDAKKYSIVTSTTASGKISLKSHELRVVKKYAQTNLSDSSEKTYEIVNGEDSVDTFDIMSIDDKTISIYCYILARTFNSPIYTYATSITVSIVGDYFEESQEELKSGTFDNGESDFSLPSNELENTANTFSGENFSQKKLVDVLDKHSNGKEVYELKCSVSDYYDKDGNISISLSDSAYPMAFEKYMIVEPYIHTSRGEVPLSTNTDGTPKQFEVIGVDFSYRGVVWQELTIQEYV
jgi:hypothetical protein